MKRRPIGKSMSTNRKYDEFKRLRSRAANVYSETRMYRRTSDEHRDCYNATIYDDPAYRLLTVAQKEYIRGVRDTLDAQLWRDLVWRLGSESGPLPEHADGWQVKSCCLCAIKLRGTKCPICYHDLKDSSGSVLGDLSRTTNALYGGHFWPGTDKAFTTYKCLNRPHCKACHHDDILHTDGGRCTDPYHKDGQCPCEAFVKA